MKRVDTIARVRRAFHIQGWSMKKIARDLHLSRNTVRKILRSDETDFTYERDHQPMPRIGPWQQKLDAFLQGNADKPPRERLTLIRIFEELRAVGYEGGYDAVRRYARSWSKTRGAVTAEAYVPLSYDPGEAYQFDWSHEIVVIAGITITVKVAHVRLCHSRMMFARAYMRESQEMVFDAHDRAFAFFKGACTRGIYDSGNCPPLVRGQWTRRPRWRPSSAEKNGITTVASSRCAATSWSIRRPLGLNQWRLNERPCTPASGWEKGQVENQVGLVRERFFTPRLRVRSLDELNGWLLDKCVAYAKAHRHPEVTDKTVWEMFETERPQLVPYAGPFDGFHSVPASVSKTCTVRFDTNKYSVSATAVGRPVEVHAYADRIVIRQDGVIVGEHARAFGRNQTVYDPWHYVPVLASKPGALRNGAPFKDWVLPPAMAAIRRKLKGSDDGDRQMVQILSCVPDDGLQAVEAACREAVDQGVHSAPVVINILARRRDTTPLPLLLTPTALRLTHEPVADCARYDSLRRTSRHGTHPNLRPDG